MNQYVTGTIIKKLREEKRMTQLELADIIGVTDKAVSKWETGKGYPDITLLDPLSRALGISTIELLSGDSITNENLSCNMKKMKFYVCPICGNIILATGESVISCCGITLPALEAEKQDDSHELIFEEVEDEYYVTMNHPMTKEHYISFIAAVTDSGVQLTKLYPEGGCETRFKRRGLHMFYYYCNHHGLYKVIKMR